MASIINFFFKPGIRGILKQIIREETRCGLKTVSENKVAMSASDGILLQEVVKQLGKFASTKLAEKWDNVGLLVEPSGCHKVKRILLTNDLTQAVLEEAVRKSVEMIISYHPPIFAPLKRLSQGNWKERIITKCIEKRIAVYSPHTSFDAVIGGVNDWLIQCFRPGDIQPIIQSFDTSFAKTKPNSCFKLTLTLNSDLPTDYLAISDRLNSMQEVLSVNDRAISPGCNQVEIIVIPSDVALAKVYDEAENVLKPSCALVSRLENLPLPGYGMGRLIKLRERITIKDGVNKVKEHIGVPHVRLALARKAGLSKQISSVAVCAGSGGSVLKGVDADLYVTGELSHHEVLHAVESGRSVILCEHSNSERGFLKTLVPLMKEWFKEDVCVDVSVKDKDPLTVV